MIGTTLSDSLPLYHPKLQLYFWMIVQDWSNVIRIWFRGSNRNRYHYTPQKSRYSIFCCVRSNRFESLHPETTPELLNIHWTYI